MWRLWYSERTCYATVSGAVLNVVAEPTWAMHPLQRYSVSCFSRRGTSKCCLGYSSVVKFQNTRKMFRFEFLKKKNYKPSSSAADCEKTL